MLWPLLLFPLQNKNPKKGGKKKNGNEKKITLICKGRKRMRYQMERA